MTYQDAVEFEQAECVWLTEYKPCSDWDADLNWAHDVLTSLDYNRVRTFHTAPDGYAGL